jgi:myo-inositol 2-dehydrogenase/D-chiro-inositol 1-dehydrogenase
LATNVAPTTVKKYSTDSVEARKPYLDFFLERYAFSYRQELALFIQSISSGETLNPTFDDGRAALILADAATESARTGKTIAVNLG